MLLLRRMAGLWAALGLLAMPVGPLGMAQAKQRYAKTEVERAAGKCVGSILGGALLGAVLGRVIGGRQATGTGIALGTSAGAAVCAILMANARHKDEMIAAQLNAVRDPSRPYSASWTDDEGKPVTFTSRSEPVASAYDGAQLLPVKYKGADGIEQISPTLPAGTTDCRMATGTFDSGATVRPQMTCRTADGNWHPYGQPNT